MHRQCCEQNVSCCCVDQLPWGSVGDTLTAGQNPFLRTAFAGAGGRLQIDVPLQHAPPQFQACPLPRSFRQIAMYGQLMCRSVHMHMCTQYLLRDDTS